MQYNIGIKHGFSCINVCQVPREVLKTDGFLSVNARLLIAFGTAFYAITQITRTPIKKINASYTLEGTVLDNVEKIKYLGINITNKACPKDVKESANKGLVTMNSY